MSELANPSNDQKLVSDMEAVIADTEDILAQTAGATDDRMVVLRQRLSEHLRNAKSHLVDANAAFVEKVEAAVSVADVCVRKNPWQSIGVAAGVGLLIGIIIGRR